MNFDDLTRGGTAPDAHSKGGVVSTSTWSPRPRTRAADNDMQDFNIELKMNKYKSGSGADAAQQQQSDEDDEEYQRAIESFQAAIDDWSGNRSGSYATPDQPLSPARGSGTATTSNASSRTNSASGSRPRQGKSGTDSSKRSNNASSSAVHANNAAVLAAYTQNIPNIVLHNSKRPGKAHNSNVSPRVQREQRSNTNQLNELRAVYGADTHDRSNLSSRQMNRDPEDRPQPASARDSHSESQNTSGLDSRNGNSKLVAGLRANLTARSRGPNNPSELNNNETPRRKTKRRSTSLNNDQAMVTAAARAATIASAATPDPKKTPGSADSKSLKRSTVYSVTAVQGSTSSGKDNASLLKTLLKRRTVGRTSSTISRPSSAAEPISDEAPSPTRDSATVNVISDDSDGSYGDGSYPSLCPPAERLVTTKRPMSNNTIETNYDDHDWLEDVGSGGNKSPMYSKIVEVAGGKQPDGRRSASTNIVKATSRASEKTATGAVYRRVSAKKSSGKSRTGADVSNSNVHSAAEPKVSASEESNLSEMGNMRMDHRKEKKEARSSPSIPVSSVPSAANVKSSSEDDHQHGKQGSSPEEVIRVGSADSDFLFLDIQVSDDVGESLDDAEFLDFEQKKGMITNKPSSVRNGGKSIATSGAGSKGKLRPQSRKLYLGTDATTPDPANSKQSTPGSKAPRSAGARYNAPRSNPLLGESEEYELESSKEGDAHTSNNTSGAHKIDNTQKLKSFHDKPGGQPTSSPWKENESHLQRPPSRQRSAFPTHLADTPGATTPEVDSTTKRAEGAAVADSKKVVPSPYAVGDSFDRQAATAPAPYSKSQNSGHDDAMRSFHMGNGEKDDVKDEKPINVSAPIHRPPSRQKIGALHLFDARKASPAPPSLSRSNSSVAHQSPRRSDASYTSTSSMQSGHNSGQVGIATPSERMNTTRSNPNMYYNPKEDGFLDLDTSHEKMPFRIKVTYGGRPASKKGSSRNQGSDASTSTPDFDRRLHGTNHESHLRSPLSEALEGVDNNHLSPITVSRAMQSNNMLPSGAAMPRASSQKDPIRPMAINLTTSNSDAGPKASSGLHPRPKHSLQSIHLAGSSSNSRLISNINGSQHMRRSKSTSEFIGSTNSSAAPSPRDVFQGRTIHDSGSGRGPPHHSGGAFGGWADHGNNRTQPPTMVRGYDNSSPFTIGRATNTSSPSVQFLQNQSRSASSNAEPFSPSSPGHAAIYSDDDDDYEEDDTVLTEDSGVKPGMETVPSMQSLALESSLGEDFLSLFAPGPR